MRVLHVEDASALAAPGPAAGAEREPNAHGDQLRGLLERLDELLALAPSVADDAGAGLDEGALRAELDRVAPRIDELRARAGRR